MTDSLRAEHPELGQFFRVHALNRFGKLVASAGTRLEWRHPDLILLADLGLANALPVLAEATNSALERLGVDTKHIEEVEEVVLEIARGAGYDR